MTDKPFEIRPLRSLDEMQGAVDLQKTYWGEDDSSLVPAHMLFSIVSHGGHVLAAMDGAVMAGVVVGLVGIDPDAVVSSPSDVYLYSKRMVVSREYRNHGLGAWLKFAQRDYALEHGIERVMWTFDPLLSMNAHLNLRKLGATSRRFYQDYYGTNNTGGLSPMGYSDRLRIEWRLTEEGVAQRAQGSYEATSLEQYLEAGAVIVNPAAPDNDGFPTPPEQVRDPAGAVALVEIPRNYYEMAERKPDLITQWRAHNRQSLGWLIACGYAVVDFVSGRGRAFYVLRADAAK